MGSDTRTIKGTTFRQFATVEETQKLFFVSGQTIAVETWALMMGQHEFDYQLNSRETSPDGLPQAIATTEGALDREFLERRVVFRSPIPLSVAFPNGLKPVADITYGEVVPQIYKSRVRTSTVAWSLNFKKHYLNSVQGKFGTAKGAVSPSSGALATAQMSAAAQNIATGLEYLTVYVPVADFGKTRRLNDGFGVNDVIGQNPSWIDGWMTKVRGE